MWCINPNCLTCRKSGVALEIKIRQLGGVALAQAKSMEKLSSGYRINRAGDAAAAGKRREVTVNGITSAASVVEKEASVGKFETKAAFDVHAANATTKYSIKYNDASGSLNRIDINVSGADTANAAYKVEVNGVEQLHLCSRKSIM